MNKSYFELKSFKTLNFEKVTKNYSTFSILHDLRNKLKKRNQINLLYDESSRIVLIHLFALVSKEFNSVFNINLSSKLKLKLWGISSKLMLAIFKKLKLMSNEQKNKSSSLFIYWYNFIIYYTLLRNSLG
jgi:hypothetical protein